MNLYSVHQPDPGSHSHEHEHWEAVWADTPEEAKAFYVARYKGECDPHNDDFGDGVDVAIVAPAKHHGVTPKENVPHFEGRYAVLRDLGWRSEGESPCENCGRCAMDTDKWRVCDECEMCLECGHADDCQEGVEAVLVEKSR